MKFYIITGSQNCIKILCSAFHKKTRNIRYINGANVYQDNSIQRFQKLSIAIIKRVYDTNIQQLKTIPKDDL